MKHKKYVTAHFPKTIIFESQYGFVTFAGWLDREKKRLADHGVKTNIHENKNGDIALARE